MIRSVLEEFALVLSNPSPNEVLDSITTDDMRAFATPGGLLWALEPKQGTRFNLNRDEAV